MPSASPVSGAISTEPFTSTISAWRPVSAKWARGDPRVLGRDADAAKPAQRLRERVAVLVDGDDHPAGAEAQVEQLVDVAIGLLGEHVAR